MGPNSVYDRVDQCRRHARVGSFADGRQAQAQIGRQQNGFELRQVSHRRNLVLVEVSVGDATLLQVQAFHERIAESLHCRAENLGAEQHWIHHAPHFVDGHQFERRYLAGLAIHVYFGCLGHERDRAVSQRGIESHILDQVFAC